MGGFPNTSGTSDVQSSKSSPCDDSLNDSLENCRIAQRCRPASIMPKVSGESSRPRTNFPVQGVVHGISATRVYVKATIDNVECWFMLEEIGSDARITKGFHKKTKVKLCLCQPVTIMDARKCAGRASEDTIWTVIDYEPGTLPTSYEQVVAVHKRGDGFVQVVGNHFKRPQQVLINAKDASNVKYQDFIMATCLELPSFMQIKCNGTTTLVTKDEELQKDFQNRPWFYKKKPPGKHIIAVRQLTQEEKKKLTSMCHNVSDDEFNLDQARLFILEPLVAAFRLEQWEEHLLAAPRNINVLVKIRKLTDAPSQQDVIECYLNDEQTKRCISDDGSYKWNGGCDLSLRHPALDDHVLAVIVESYKVERNATVVTMFVDERSKELFHILKLGLRSGEKCKIGPSDTALTSASLADWVDRESDGFDDFFNLRKPLFDEWSGRRKVTIDPLENIMNRDETIGARHPPLDPSQLASMRTAVVTPGFTCIAAPPGSGKTHTIAGLVAAIDAKKDYNSRIVVAATTNVAVTNVIDVIHENFNDIRVCREYSFRSESEISEKSAKHSIRAMAKRACYGDQYLSSKEKKSMSTIFERYRVAQINMESPFTNVDTGMKHRKALLEAERDIIKAFKAIYKPLVYGATVELIARYPDQLATHLIIDEAAQMSPLAALALYCSMRNLNQITIFGDSKQLGPYCCLEDNGAARRLLTIGELTRLESLDDGVVTKQRLNGIYRCHPDIVESILKTIYGPDIIPSVRPTERNTVKAKGLPAAKDGSPFLFIDVRGSNGANGVNEDEIDVLLNLLNKLEKKGVTGKDVSVICYHLAQKAAVTEKLKGKGAIGLLGLPVEVSTIDSFQGKEAKIVIVLTTKVSLNMRRLRFVSNPNRGTVALSRARDALYVIGDWSGGLATMPFWNQFGKSIRGHGAIVDRNFKEVVDPVFK